MWMNSIPRDSKIFISPKFARALRNVIFVISDTYDRAILLEAQVVYKAFFEVDSVLKKLVAAGSDAI
jgi:hypothetical protein